MESFLEKISLVFQLEMNPLELISCTEASSVDSVFAGVVRAPIATQNCRTGVPELGYSPLSLLEGGEFISELGGTAATGMAFYGQYPRKELHILRRECA